MGSRFGDVAGNLRLPAAVALLAETGMRLARCSAFSIETGALAPTTPRRSRSCPGIIRNNSCPRAATDGCTSAASGPALRGLRLAPVRVGRHLVPGNASACANADNYNCRGQVEDSRQWCQAGGVTLVLARAS